MNTSLIENTSRHPAAVLNAFEACPARLRDESLQTLVKVAKILSHEGLRARVLTLCESLDSSRKAAIRRAILPTRVFN